MLSRAACAPRLCLACRVGLAQRTAGAGARLVPSDRRLASSFDSGAQDKSRVEALISGKTTFAKDSRDRRAATKAQAKTRRQGRRPRQQEELGWGGDVLAEKTTQSTIQTSRPQSAEQTPPEPDTQPHPEIESILDLESTPDPESEPALEATPSTPKPPREQSLVTRILQGEFENDSDPSFDWRAGLEDPLGDPNTAPTEIRSAAAPDEAFPGYDLPEEDVSEPFEWPEEKEWADGEREGSLENPFLAHEEGASQKSERGSYSRSDRYPERSRTLREFNEASEGAQSPPREELFRQHELALGAMGKRINTLIMKNPNKLNQKNKKRPEVRQDKSTTADAVIDWQSLVSSEDADIQDAASIVQNIESIRPLDISIVSKAEFLHLQEQLMDFTIKQLALYHKSLIDQSSLADIPEQTYPWLLSQTTWTPSNPVVIEDKTTKPQIATRILVKNWKLQIQEEVESPGVTIAKVLPDVFQLIAQPQTGVLDLLAAEMLDESIGETVTPIHESSSIQIYARKAVIPAILTELNHLVQSTVTRTLSTEDIDPKLLEKDVLRELARVTKTVIKHAKGTSKLKVSWVSLDPSELQNEDSPLPTETTADTVLRLLRGRPSDRLITDEQIILRDIPSEATLAKSGKLAAHCRETRSLAWKDRLSSWSRIVGPVAKAGEAGSQSLKLGVKVQLPDPEPSIYEDGATNQVSATFGHVLHPNPPRTKQSKLRTKEPQNYRRILAPVVPHPATFTELCTSVDEEVEKQASIILNFIPAAGHPGSDGPEVQLRLPIHPGDDFSNFTMSEEATLKAVVPWHVQDILVPEETVDVRVSQRREMPLDISEQTSILEFFEASDFNLIEGRLQTPSNTDIKIPSKWLDKTTQGTSSIDVPYHFAGLEIHQTVNLPFKKHILRYNSIEAGQHGGTRQELSIVANVTSDDPEEAANQRKAFLRIVGTAIEGRFWSWSNGAKQIRELPDDDDDAVWQPSMRAPVDEPRPVQYSSSRTMVEDVPEWSVGEESIQDTSESAQVTPESDAADTHHSLLYRGASEEDVGENKQHKAARSLRDLLSDHDETGENMVSQDGHTFVKDVFLDADAQPVEEDVGAAAPQADDTAVSQEIEEAEQQIHHIIKNGRSIVREAEDALKAIYSSENAQD